MVEMAKALIDIGVRMLKIDVLPAGFSALQAVSEFLHRENLEVGITVYPAMHRVYERHIDRGILLAMARLAGADIIYAGNPPSAQPSGRVQGPAAFTKVVSNHLILKKDKPFQ